MCERERGAGFDLISLFLLRLAYVLVAIAVCIVRLSTFAFGKTTLFR
jgi:hypothetical protein